MQRKHYLSFGKQDIEPVLKDKLEKCNSIRSSAEIHRGASHLDSSSLNDEATNFYQKPSTVNT